MNEFMELTAIWSAIEISVNCHWKSKKKPMIGENWSNFVINFDI